MAWVHVGIPMGIYTRDNGRMIVNTGRVKWCMILLIMTMTILMAMIM